VIVVTNEKDAVLEPSGTQLGAGEITKGSKRGWPQDERFQLRFAGEHIYPATRPNFNGTPRRFDAAAQARQRNGRCANCDD
jgi:hypothetical protein